MVNQRQAIGGNKAMDMSGKDGIDKRECWMDDCHIKVNITMWAACHYIVLLLVLVHHCYLGALP